MFETAQDCCKKEVFETLYRTLSKDILRFLYYKFGADNHPEDIVQEAFIKLWKNCQHVLPQKAKAFLIKVSSNHMLNDIEKKKVSLNFNKSLTVQEDKQDPEFLMRESEFGDRLKKALEELPEHQRVAFLMNRVEKKKHQEIADLLGIGRKAVEKRIYSAVKTLKEKLGEI